MALVAVVGILVLPWLRHLPESLASWRITQDWLDGYPPKRDAALAPLRLAWSFFTTQGKWGGSQAADVVLLGVFVAIVLGVLSRKRMKVLLLRSPLPLLWFVAACLAPPFFDVLRQSQAALIPRYALSGLPAGMLLLGIALGRLGPRMRRVALCAILVAWLPGWVAIFQASSRHLEDYREIADQIGERALPEDVVLVHSTPTGVLGVARYMNVDVDMASWVGQLGVRTVPRDIETLIAGRRHVFFVAVHDVGEPAPEGAWLREHARLERDWLIQQARLMVYSPSTGEVFPEPR